MSHAAELALAVNRIIDTPYPVCLKPLYNAVEYCSDRIIEEWVVSNPCRLEALARALHEDDDIQPHVLLIIERLCHQTDFRDVFLAHDRTWLNYMLQFAIDTLERDGILDISAKVCIQVLSRPLPSSVPLPGLAQSFLKVLFRKIHAKDPQEIVLAIRSLLEGECRVLVSSLGLDRETISRLEAGLFSILRGPRGVADSLFVLACTNILSILAHPGHCLKQNPHVSDRTKALFNGPGAIHHLERIVQRVLSLCQNICSKNLNSTTDAIRIGSAILYEFPLSYRRDWISNQNNKQDLDTVVAKALWNVDGSLHYSSEIQLEIMGFAVLLNDKIVARCLEKPSTNVISPHYALVCSERAYAQVLERVTPYIMKIVQPDMLSEMFRGFQSQTCSTTRASIERLRMSRCFINTVSNSVQDSEGARSKVSRTLGSEVMEPYLEKLSSLQESVASSCASGDSICSIALVCARKELSIEICSLAITASVGLNANLTNSTVFRLIKASHDIVKSLTSCHDPWKLIRPTRSIAMVHVPATPSEDVLRLQNELKRTREENSAIAAALNHEIAEKDSRIRELEVAALRKDAVILQIKAALPHSPCAPLERVSEDQENDSPTLVNLDLTSSMEDRLVESFHFTSSEPSQKTSTPPNRTRILARAKSTDISRTKGSVNYSGVRRAPGRWISGKGSRKPMSTSTPAHDQSGCPPPDFGSFSQS